MVYKTRPGIVLLKICDVDVLAATRQTWEHCPAIRPIPRMWAGCWAVMQKGRTSEDVIDTFVRLFRRPEEEIRKRFDKIFTTLYEAGYLIPAEEEK